MDRLATTISFACASISITLAIIVIPIYLSIARLADNVDSVRHRLDKIIDTLHRVK